MAIFMQRVGTIFELALCRNQHLLHRHHQIQALKEQLS
jgi:hypothetical protein